MLTQEQSRPAMAGDIASLIADAYQAECERFDHEIERTDADVFACRLDLLRAARTPRMRALVERLAEAEEAAAEARRRGFFAAGVEAGIRIGKSSRESRVAGRESDA